MNKKQLKAVLASVFLPLGYSSVKNMFFRRVGEVFLIVNLDKSPYGESFMVDLGLYVDESGSLAQPPPYNKTHIIQPLTRIVSQDVRDALVPALDLELPMAAKERSDLISSVLEQHAVPYLNSLSTLEGIADRLVHWKYDSPIAKLELREILSRRTGRNVSVYRSPNS